MRCESRLEPPATVDGVHGPRDHRRIIRRQKRHHFRNLQQTRGEGEGRKGTEHERAAGGHVSRSFSACTRGITPIPTPTLTPSCSVALFKSIINQADNRTTAKGGQYRIPSKHVTCCSLVLNVYFVLSADCCGIEPVRYCARLTTYVKWANKDTRSFCPHRGSSLASPRPSSRVAQTVALFCTFPSASPRVPHPTAAS